MFFTLLLWHKTPEYQSTIKFLILLKGDVSMDRRLRGHTRVSQNRDERGLDVNSFEWFLKDV